MKVTLFSFLTLLILTLNVNAEKIQILFTNDTHSHFTHNTLSKEAGGYARLKTLIEKYQDEAAFEYVPTLVLDGGDFLEGNIYYMADSSRKSLGLHSHMGYHAVALGNHDYLMGSDELNAILGDTPFNFSLLAANVNPSEKYPNIKKKIKPFQEFVIRGKKIAIMGLTSNQKIYTFRFNDTRVTDPIKAGLKLDSYLKKERGNDVVIALTHIGIKKDAKLIKKSKNIDLVVGGHSHTHLYEPLYQKNKKKKMIPIVQAGKHIEKLGRMIIDIDENNNLKILDYQLIPVTSDIAEDPLTKAMIREADDDLNRLYGKEWLEYIVGESYVPRQHPEGAEEWAFYVTDSMKEAVDSDIAVYTPSMTGDNYPSLGPVSRKDLLNGHPRFFEVKNTLGWNIYQINIPGYFLKTFLKIVTKYDLPLAVAGMTFQSEKVGNGKYKIRKIRVDGKKIKPFKRYSMAISEGIIRGAIGLSRITRLIGSKANRTSVKILQAMEKKFSRIPFMLATEKGSFYSSKNKMIFPGDLD